MPSPSTLRRVSITLAAAVLVPVIPFLLIGELPGERWLSQNDDQALIFAGVGMVLLALDVVLPVPSSIVGVTMGARLGFLLSFACIWIGLLSGHLGGYWLGRLAPSRFGEQLPTTPSTLGVFVTRPVPVLAEAVALGAGALRVPFASFALATLSGDAIYAAALAASGSAFLPEGWLVTALAVPLGLGALGWLAFRRAFRKGPAQRS